MARGLSRWLLIGLVLVASAACEKAKPPRGLILISLDTLRADHLGTYGYDRPTSPNLDAFAEESVVFEKMVAPAPNTPPSHMAMFTGLLPVQSGFMGGLTETTMDILSDEHTTLPEILSSHGFATGSFTGGGRLHSESFFRGFDVHEVGGHLGTNPGVQWLKKHPDERFFLFLHSYQVHAPYIAAKEYKDLFVDPEYEVTFRPIPANLGKVRVGRKKLTPEELAYARDSYDAGIRQADAQLQAIFDELEQAGILDEAIVIVTSDHGEEFLEHGSMGHWQIFYRPNLHVPFLLRLPGGAEGGRRIEALSEHIDLLPTVLDLLDLPPHPEAYGRSWAAAVRGGKPPEPRPALAWSARPNEDPRRSVIAEGHQLMVDVKTGDAALYDLSADPTAQNDIAEERPEVRDRLLAVWKEWEPKEKGAWASQSEHVNVHLRKSLEALGYLEPSE